MLRSIINSGRTKIFKQATLLQQRCKNPGVRSMSSTTGLSLTIDNDIAVIHMQKEDNRLNTDFFDTFHDYLDQVEGNTQIKGLITTGEGKFYSNGLHLEWMASLSPDEFIDAMKRFMFFNKRILVFPVPMLAAINGHAFAGGAVMAYAQDFRVMNEERGWICLNEIQLNKRFYGFLSSMLRTKVGTGINVTNTLVFGKRFTGQEALDSGLINSKSSSSQLLEHSAALLKSYVGKDGLGRSALQAVKEEVYVDCLKAYDEFMNHEKVNHGFSKQFMTDVQLKDFNNKS